MDGKENLSLRAYLAIGMMLFALFFGAGNLIFPAALGQHAGSNVGWALAGFVLTGVGLPLLGVMAMGYSGCKDVEELAGRVHPIYGLIYTVALYLSIGPMFATPRTGTVAYEIAIKPFLQGVTLDMQPLFLAIFFGISLWLSISPQKLVNRIGNILTPALLLVILLLIVKSFITPIGSTQHHKKLMQQLVQQSDKDSLMDIIRWMHWLLWYLLFLLSILCALQGPHLVMLLRKQ